MKKKPPLFNERALITREIMRSRDAQCNTAYVCPVIDHEFRYNIAKVAVDLQTTLTML